MLLCWQNIKTLTTNPTVITWRQHLINHCYHTTKQYRKESRSSTKAYLAVWQQKSQLSIVVDKYSNWTVAQRSHYGTVGLFRCVRNFLRPLEFVKNCLLIEVRNSQLQPRKHSCDTGEYLWLQHTQIIKQKLKLKPSKRLISDNTTSNRNLDSDKFQRATLQYRNIPHRDTKLDNNHVPSPYLWKDPHYTSQFIVSAL